MIKPHKMVDGIKIDLTDEEIADRDAAGEIELASAAANQWAKNRRDEYLSIEDQLDMLYWDMKNGTTNFIDHRTEVKNNNPKP